MGRWSAIGWMALAPFCAALLPVAAMAGRTQPNASISHPPSGSIERKAIMDVLRSTGYPKGTLFIVRELNLSGNWAYAHVTPSRNGQTSGEDSFYVLQRRNAKWSISGGWGGGEECADFQAYRFVTGNGAVAPRGLIPANHYRRPVDGGRGC